MLFRRRRKNAEPAAQAVAAAVAVPAVPAPAEENSRELMVSVMRAAPDLRYRAASRLGLLEGLAGASGPELERRLLERARDARMLTALEEALAR